MRTRGGRAEQTYKLLQRKTKGHPGQRLHRAEGGDPAESWWRWNRCEGVFLCVRFQPYPSGGSYFPGCAPALSWLNPSCHSYCSREDPSSFPLPKKQKHDRILVLVIVILAVHWFGVGCIWNEQRCLWWKHKREFHLHLGEAGASESARGTHLHCFYSTPPTAVTSTAASKVCVCVCVLEWG